MRHKSMTVIMLLAAMLTVSCSMLEPNSGDPSEGIVPVKFSIDEGDAQALAWWTVLGSDELNQLVENVLKGNNTLAQAAARLRQVRAVAVQRGAAKWPEVTGQAGFGFTERQKATTPDGDASSEVGSIGIEASYEVDLWGRVAATANSARLDAEASREDLDSARITISAETVLRYFELLAARQKLDLIKEQIETSEKVAGLVELRFKRSQASALDVLQQRENLAAVESLVPPLKGRETLLLNELAVLTGRPAGMEIDLKVRKIPKLPAMPGTGLPSSLLARRPDVRAALLRLESAGATVAAARADRLPALRLTGSAGYSSAEIDELFDNWMLQIAAAIMGPIIDGGRRKAEVERTRAVVDERLAAYRNTVLQALREVEDSLVLEKRQDEYLGALQRQLDASRLSYSEAASRYRKGAESYLSVLIALSNVQRLERQMVDAVYTAMSYRVRLHRALAGGWNGEDKAGEENR